MKNVNSDYLSLVDATRICFKKSIFIYRVPISNDSMKIEIDYKGRKKLGTEVYKWRTDKDKMTEKIQELYVTIAKQIQDR
tara:strand:+ start:6057 stop:6296 length:240 start_codon:yes stop_codon:yes gene_type:complete